MVSGTREKRLAAAFVTLADTLVAGYDVVELLQTLVDTCAELLDATAAGILLADPAGKPGVIASTSEESRRVDEAQTTTGRGPSIQCFTTGQAIAVPDIAAVDDDWSEFRAEALAQGFRSAHAVPLRLRGRIIGTLTLLRAETGGLSADDRTVAQGLADVATIGILHERAARESDLAQMQLQHALNSRVVIEQAKGVIAHVRSVDMSDAFQILRTYSRAHNQSLRDVADLVVSRELSL
jgi:GAF domain-containing protein